MMGLLSERERRKRFILWLGIKNSTTKKEKEPRTVPPRASGKGGKKEGRTPRLFPISMRGEEETAS